MASVTQKKNSRYQAGVHTLPKYKKFTLQPSNSHFVGKVLLHFPALPSTNAYAQYLLQRETVAEGTVISTDHQQAGRGQRGNDWVSAPGQNITLSVVLYPRFLAPAYHFQLNKMAALAVRDTVAEATGQASFVKWPNDVYLNEQKICGILIQNSLQGIHLQHSIVGIGLNVNQRQFPATLPRASSLARATGQSYDRTHLRQRLCSYLEQWYEVLRSQPHAVLDRAYLQHLYLYQQTAWYRRTNGERFRGTISGISPHGHLIMQTPAGVEHFGIKDVTLEHKCTDQRT